MRAGERIRLRLVNARARPDDGAALRGPPPVVVAIDGQPCDPHEPDGGRIVLGPAMRTDVMIDMQGEPGRRYEVIDDFYDGLAYTLTELVYDTEPPLRAHPLDAPLGCRAIPCPSPISPRPSAMSSCCRAA